MTLLQWMERRLAGLFGRSAAPTLAAAVASDHPAGEPKWLQLARADLGIRELLSIIAKSGQLDAGCSKVCGDLGFPSERKCASRCGWIDLY